MKIRYPSSEIEQQIGFGFVRNWLVNAAVSDGGKKLCQNLLPHKNYSDFVKMQAEVSARLSLEAHQPGALRLNKWIAIPQNITKTKIEGYYLSIDEVNDLRSFLDLAVHVFSQINKLDTAFEPLFPYSSATDNLSNILKQIHQLIDKKGLINPKASPTLYKLLNQKDSLENELQKTLRQAFKEIRKQDSSIDLEPGVRNGRYVIPVNTSMRNTIEGVVQGESAGGKISYIEPLAVIQTNNLLADITFDINREIEQLLKALSANIAPFVNEILFAEKKLVYLDFLQSIVKFSLHFKAIMPLLTAKNEQVKVLDARHPQLQEHLTELKRKVIPLSFTFDNANRIMLISGPNAGGKSVALKTFCVAQFAAQCALPICALEGASTIWFDNFMTDVGDNQSMDSDLSTYSAHLVAMKNFLTPKNGKTFIAVDEIGAGTDPLLGSPMAEAMLNNFDENNYYGIVTTHFSNLKSMADKGNGIFNASMLIDTQKMEPLFQLVIGKPGSSFVFELAQRTGIPNKIIKLAQSKTSKDHAKIDFLLADLDTKQAELFKAKQNADKKLLELNKMIADYETLKSNLVNAKQQILKQAKEEASVILSSANKQIERTVKEIKEKKAAKITVQNEKQKIAKTQEKIKTEDADSALKVTAPVLEKHPWKVGDFASIDNQTSPVEIVAIKNKKAEVIFQNTRTFIALDRLYFTKGTQQPNSSKSIRQIISSKLESFSPRLDLRGKREEEALQILTHYFDDAFALGTSEVKIIHGKGDGALKRATSQFLKTLSFVKEWSYEHAERGGEGATLVRLR